MGSSRECDDKIVMPCDSEEFITVRLLLLPVVGPCHHSMARPQVVDRGTASDEEGSCEYIE